MTAVPVLVDASVAMKWLFAEEQRPIALRLLNSHQRGEVELRAPDTNDASDVFELFLSMSPKLFPGTLFATRALRISVDHRRTFYDSLCLACAVRWNCELITADAKFFNAMSAKFPQVRLLSTD